MNVNLIDGTQGAQGATPAATTNAVDAALFQNLMAAASLQKGGATLPGVTLPGAGSEGMTEGLDIGLLMKLLLGGGVLADTGVLSESETIAGEALLAALAETPAEELIAASGMPDGAQAAELLADADALLDALAMIDAGINAAEAADASANSAAAETIIANGESASAASLTELAGALRSLATDATSGLITAESAGLAKAVRVETPRASALAQNALPLDDPAVSASAPLADAITVPEAALAARSGDAFVNGEALAVPTPESNATLIDTSAARGSEGAFDAANAGTQGGFAASGAESARAQAQSGAASGSSPYSQVASEIFAAIANKNVPTVLSMRLEPAELGKIDVSLKLTAAGKLVIDIAAESAKTQALLAGQTDKLVQALGLQNVQVENVSMADRAAFSGQQQAWTYGDRSMAFFMDLAGKGDGDDRADRDDPGKHLKNMQALTGIPEEGMSEQIARYARRLDLTA
jgi:flagellar hook-length control protein FliK